MMMMMDKLATFLLITLFLISLNIRPSPADEIPTSTPNHEAGATTSVEKESVDVTTAPNDAGTKADALPEVPVTNVTTESSNQAGLVPDSTPKTSSESLTPLHFPVGSSSQNVPPEIASPVVPLHDSTTETGPEAVPTPNVQSSTNSDSAPIARSSEKVPQSNSQPPPVVPQSNSQNSLDGSVAISQPTPVAPQSNSPTSPVVPHSNSQPSPDLSVENSQPNQTTSAEDLTKEPPRSKPAKKDNDELVADEIFNMETKSSKKPNEELEPINATSNEITYDNVTTSYENFTEVTDYNERVDEDKYVNLIFSGDCDPTEISSKSEVEVTDFAERKDTLENGSCKRQIILKMNFLDEEARNLMKSMVGKLGLTYEKRPMKLVEVDATYEYTVAVENSTTSDNYLAGLSYGEFVSYVVIASCFGSVVLIGACLLCLKCCWCCRREKNELMTDIPHLTLRLEDYALTRIPRPNTVYSESSKCPIMMADDASTCNASVQGLPRSTDGGHVSDGSRMSRAYDTEVVPLDDYENPYATPGYHHNGIHNGNEMRTFRRQMDQSTQGPPPNGPSREKVAFNDSSSVTDSTEKLARDFYRRKGGGGGTTPDYARENPNFNS